PSLPLFPGTAHCRQAKADQQQISCWPPSHRSLALPGPAIFLAIPALPALLAASSKDRAGLSASASFDCLFSCQMAAALPVAGLNSSHAGLASDFCTESCDSACQEALLCSGWCSIAQLQLRPAPARRQVLTKDSVTVSVDAVVYYRVSNATVSVANVENAHHSTRLLAQTTLRNVLGTKDLAEILSERDSISTSMQQGCPSAGCSCQRAMAAEAEADREARAKV
uniref:PHB domain-containing protein n=1 Tax=Macrostomum lignano TaxID=282301 RepID=A0A1I8F6Q6_9PLAT